MLKVKEWLSKKKIASRMLEKAKIIRTAKGMETEDLPELIKKAFGFNEDTLKAAEAILDKELTQIANLKKAEEDFRYKSTLTIKLSGRLR